MPSTALKLWLSSKILDLFEGDIDKAFSVIELIEKYEHLKLEYERKNTNEKPVN